MLKPSAGCAVPLPIRTSASKVNAFMIAPLSKSENTTAPRMPPAEGVTSIKPSVVLVAAPLPPVDCQLAFPYSVRVPLAVGLLLKLKEAVAASSCGLLQRQTATHKADVTRENGRGQDNRSISEVYR